MISSTKVSLSKGGSTVLISCPTWDNDRAKQIPERKWDGKDLIWKAPVTITNIRYILKEYSTKEILPSAQQMFDDILRKEKEAKSKSKIGFPAWYAFKEGATPMKHQLRAMNKAWGADAYAFFHQMRTGKTFTSINIVCAYGMAGDINAAVVLCPTSIKNVWDLQIPQWSPIANRVHVLQSGDKKIDKFITCTEDKGMKWLVVGIEALSQGNAHKAVQRFMTIHKCAMILDESSRIKNPQSIRTKKCIDLGSEAKKRFILTGTSVTNGVEDLYAQMRFLDWRILGFKSFFSFKARHCIMGGFEGRQVTGYRGIKDLLELMEDHVDVVETEDAFDLPPKVYETRYIKPTKAQLDAMQDLKDLMFTESEGDVLEVSTILERMTRYQQIAGGSFPFNTGEEGKKYDVKPIAGRNPKIDELLEVLEEVQDKTIIWARFKPEIAAITAALDKRFGSGSYVEFHGGIDYEGRKRSVERFNDDGDCRYFVSNQQVGGMGQELSAAGAMVYYSNSFSYEDRRQSEARTDSVHQKHNSILYVDLVLDHKVDKMISIALQRKHSLASYVTKELKGSS